MIAPPLPPHPQALAAPEPVRVEPPPEPAAPPTPRVATFAVEPDRTKRPTEAAAPPSPNVLVSEPPALDLPQAPVAASLVARMIRRLKSFLKGIFS